MLEQGNNSSWQLKYFGSCNVNKLNSCEMQALSSSQSLASYTGKVYTKNHIYVSQNRLTKPKEGFKTNLVNCKKTFGRET